MKDPSRFLNRLDIASAFRALRWSHHVRQIALERPGSAGRKLGRPDPVLDIVNIASGVGAFLLGGVLAGSNAQ